MQRFKTSDFSGNKTIPAVEDSSVSVKVVLDEEKKSENHEAQPDGITTESCGLTTNEVNVSQAAQENDD